MITDQLIASAPHVGRRRTVVGFAIVVAVVLLAAPLIASYVIEYQWWREMKQVPTWIEIMVYILSPLVVATVLTFGVLLIAHARGMRLAGIQLREHAPYVRLSSAVLLLIAVALSASAINTWTVVRYLGGWTLPAEATGWRDSTNATSSSTATTCLKFAIGSGRP